MFKRFPGKTFVELKKLSLNDKATPILIYGQRNICLI